MEENIKDYDSLGLESADKLLTEEEIKEARVQPAAAKARVQPAASVSKPTKVEYVIPVVKGDRLEPSIIKVEEVG